MAQHIVLLSGISGFFQENQPTPVADLFGTFTNACNQARQLDFELLFIQSFQELPDRSYHLAGLKNSTGDYLVFANKFFPYVAFSKTHKPLESLSENDPIPENDYVDSSELATSFVNNFTVLPKAFLELKVDADEPENAPIVSQLTDHEFAEFAFWEPRVMGDIVFNNWKKERS